MEFDFSEPVDRRSTDSLKWDVGEKELPMWVADMDFRTAPAIIDALVARAGHGVFGYTVVPDAYYNAVRGWWRERHSFTIENEWITFCTGVVPALSSVVRKLTMVGENVLVQSPVYNMFYNSIRNNGRNVISSDLVYDGTGYAIDFADLEHKLSDPQTTMMILCNPHNPVGKIWDGPTLVRIGALCKQYHVVVVSDEIHCDIVHPGDCYTPFASVSDDCAQNSITCVSPSKAFNLAGLQSASVIVPDEVLRHKVRRGLNTDEVAEPNAFAALAAIEAYTKGVAWLDSACAYIQGNKDYATSFIQSELPCVSVPASRATYLLWVDARGVGKNSEGFCQFLRQETGLFLSEGAVYGPSGRGFLRMNLACPRAAVELGVARLKAGTDLYGRAGR